MEENSKYFLIDPKRILDDMKYDLQSIKDLREDCSDDIESLSYIDGNIDVLEDYIHSIEQHLFDWQPED